MTEKQRSIAEAAIGRGQAQTYETIHQVVADMTGIDVAEVKSTLDYLSQETVLKRCATPARNVLETPLATSDMAWGWYEKGECWPTVG